MKPCTSCGKQHDRDGSECFRCWIGDGPAVTFRGGGGFGRKAFHESTDAEVIRQTINGNPNAVHTGGSWYSGPAS